MTNGIELQKEQEMERRKNHELSEQYAEKGRQFQKLQVTRSIGV